MEACVNNNKAKPQQLELAFLTLRVDYANQHRKDAGSGISHYIYIYIYITNCRQYCFGLLGLISAVLMLGWR